MWPTSLISIPKVPTIDFDDIFDPDIDINPDIDSDLEDYLNPQISLEPEPKRYLGYSARRKIFKADYSEDDNFVLPPLKLPSNLALSEPFRSKKRRRDQVDYLLAAMPPKLPKITQGHVE